MSRPCRDERELMAHRLAPVLQEAILGSGAAQTLLDAHACLAAEGSRFQVTSPQLSDLGTAAAGLIIIIRS